MESVFRIRWPNHWCFSFSISPSNEYSGLISFKIDWFDLLAVQRTLKSLQYHNSKASILWCSALFTVQLSHPYIGRRRVPWTVKAGLKRSRGLSPGALCASRERGWHPLLPSSALSRQLNSFSSADGTSAAHNWL